MTPGSYADRPDDRRTPATLEIAVGRRERHG